MELEQIFCRASVRSSHIHEVEPCLAVTCQFLNQHVVTPIDQSVYIIRGIRIGFHFLAHLCHHRFPLFLWQRRRNKCGKMLLGLGVREQFVVGDKRELVCQFVLHVSQQLPCGFCRHLRRFGRVAEDDVERFVQHGKVQLYEHLSACLLTLFRRAAVQVQALHLPGGTHRGGGVLPHSHPVQGRHGTGHSGIPSHRCPRRLPWQGCRAKR